MKKKDPTSHRIIEKRRRDRMNNCLADLSKLIPAHYMKKGRGRVEKTEIIEMAIKHLKDLVETNNAQRQQQQQQQQQSQHQPQSQQSQQQHQQPQPLPQQQQQQSQQPRPSHHQEHQHQHQQHHHHHHHQLQHQHHQQQHFRPTTQQPYEMEHRLQSPNYPQYYNHLQNNNYHLFGDNCCCNTFIIRARPISEVAGDSGGGRTTSCGKCESSSNSSSSSSSSSSSISSIGSKTSDSINGSSCNGSGYNGTNGSVNLSKSSAAWYKKVWLVRSFSPSLELKREGDET